MAFKVKARVLLELGAELISSDAIALYELIKNAIDAGTPKIEVRFVIGLTASGFRALISDLEDIEVHRVPKNLIEANLLKYFEPTASPSLRNQLVEQLAGVSKATAKAKAREFYCANSYIEIEDWGHGMSKTDLDKNFLTIGTPHRAEERAALNRDINVPILGEKGIGRLSAMRLGLHLYVATSKLKEPVLSILNINWAELGESLDLDLDKFTVAAEVGAKKPDANVQGTKIRISDLQSDWSSMRVTQIVKSELSKLQDPFDQDASVLDLRIDYNNSPLKVFEEIDTKWLDKWHGHFEVSFGYEEINRNRQPAITGTVKYRVPTKEYNPDEEVIDERQVHAVGDGLYSVLSNIDQPLSKGGTENVPPRFAGIENLGPFKAEGYWYNRLRKRRELGDDYEEFNRWLTQWAGGLLMYRDGFRVYPYAAPDDDWLELDQKALRGRSFKLNRGQFVGYVRITSRDNPNLKDQTNRQGLCDSPEQRKLVLCLQYVIWKELGALVKKYEIKSAQRALETVKEIDVQVKASSKEARTQLRELGRRAPDEKETIQALKGYIEELEAAWSKAKTAVRNQQENADVYLHLAGVGMLLEFVIHELNRVTHSTLTDLQSIKPNALPPSLRSLVQQLKTLDKRLRILDPVSTPGRQRKERTDLVEVLKTLLDAHEAQFERHKINIVQKSDATPATFETNVVVGQMYQIFENLISNSVYWLTHHRAVIIESGQDATDFTSTITILIDNKSRTITFSDNGPGIDVADGNKVFDPFFSKKPLGRGIGLYIVKNLCADNGIKVSLLDTNEADIHPGFCFQFS